MGINQNLHTKISLLHLLIFFLRIIPATTGHRLKLFPLHHQLNYRYSVDIKLGTLGNQVKPLVDAGCGFIWSQWSRTSSHPERYKTYKRLPCNHPLCARNICKCIKNQRVCTIPYGSSGNKYTLAQSIDTFHIAGSQKQKTDIVFGCSNQQPLNLSGILGLDRSPVSLIVTLGKDIPSHDWENIQTTHLIHTDHSTLFLNLTDTSVEGQRLGLSPSLFSLKNGGVFLDTGIQYTVLPKTACDKVNKVFESYFKGKLKKIDSVYWNLKPCYKLIPGFNAYPTMTFHFEGADLEAEYTHVKDEGLGVTCTAVLLGRRTVIGAVQQWGTRFIFYVNRNVLRFYKDDCSRN
ncbi:Aspartyl protease [Handroanthus impetiginosus]|uniref:Aspartyl protease n=1 Tax=Handroanthus impetiginosus TaxID=429701 RepID=A0A2G9HEM5_9LAMI|nr:Aspartyl protease [Handroanthus impetiginosus]